MPGRVNDDEAGSVDNRLSLTVADHPEIEDWEDGQMYTFSEVKVRQISPGEFEVVEASEGSPEEPMESGGEEEGEGMMGGEGETMPMARSTGNPAIDKVMAKR